MEFYFVQELSQAHFLLIIGTGVFFLLQLAAIEKINRIHRDQQKKDKAFISSLFDSNHEFKD